jgi:hypothetical protein
MEGRLEAFWIIYRLLVDGIVVTGTVLMRCKRGSERQPKWEQEFCTRMKWALWRRKERQSYICFKRQAAFEGTS